MTNLCVPYLDPELGSKYWLYSVGINNTSDIRSFNIKHAKGNDIPIIQNRLKGLRKYFKNNHYEKYIAEFELKCLSNVKKFANVLSDQTLSIFLGLFLKAVEQIKGRIFKKDWEIICATGDLIYDETDEKLHLVPVDKVYDKYKDDFTGIAEEISKENEGKKCLFIYISDEDEEDVKQYGNITVKRFSPEPKNTVEELLEYLFIPFRYEPDSDDYAPERRKLIRKMENQKGNNFDYIQGNWFKSLEPKIYKRDWCGFFIHGVGGSGKSAAAMELARCLICQGILYAPIWILVKKGDIENCLNIEAEYISKNKELKGRDEIEAYITSSIETYSDKIIDDLKKEIEIGELERKYLIILDNLELRENVIGRILQAIQKIFPYRETMPYLVITSRYECDYFKYLEDLGLNEVEIYKLNKLQSNLQPEESETCKLSKTEIELLINVSTERATKVSNKLSTAKNDGTFAELLDILFQKYSGNPRLIITSISLLEGIGVPKLTALVKKEHGRYKDVLRNEFIKMYKQAFSSLNDTVEKQTLYLFLEIGADTPISIKDINKRIQNSEHWKEKPTEDKLEEILYNLSKYKLIDFVLNQDSYKIESIPYQTFFFEEEFLGPKSESGEYLRDMFVDLELQLGMALRYDMDVDIVKPILEKIKIKNINYINDVCYSIKIGHPMYNAFKFSTNNKIFTLLDEFGYNDLGNFGYNFILKDALESARIVVLDWLLVHVPSLFNSANNFIISNGAIKPSNTIVLDWLFKNVPEFYNHSYYDGGTIFHHATAIAKNTIILERLYKDIWYLLSQPNNYGETVFHFAARHGNIAVLKWLYKKEKLLLTHPNKDGETVYHYAARAGNTNVLKWLYKKKPLLLTDPNKNGETVFHFAASYGKIAVLEWLYLNKHELLSVPNYNGETVYHYAVKSFPYIDVLKWLYKHDQKLLEKPNYYGKTACHYAVLLFINIDLDFLALLDCNSMILDILDWFLKNAPNLLDNTVYQIAKENNCTAALDWFSEKVPYSCN